jgi:Complex 1 protein (LYR family)
MTSKPLALFRAILRAARTMPTTNRREFIKKKARAEFEKARSETNAEKLAMLVAYAEVSLDNILAQSAHLAENALFAPVATRSGPKKP